MANGITTSSVLPPAVRQDLALRLLSVKVPYLIHKLFAMKDRLNRNSGDTKRYRRYNKLGTAPVPLGNSGVTPPAKQLSAVDIDAKISWYMDWVEVNEQVPGKIFA